MAVDGSESMALRRACPTKSPSLLVRSVDGNLRRNWYAAIFWPADGSRSTFTYAIAEEGTIDEGWAPSPDRYAAAAQAAAPPPTSTTAPIDAAITRRRRRGAGGALGRIAPAVSGSSSGEGPTGGPKLTGSGAAGAPAGSMGSMGCEGSSPYVDM